MRNHYYNDTHPLRPYTHSLAAMPGSIPPVNALRGDAPTAKPGFWPCEKDGAWVYGEDHRGEEGYVNGEPYTINDFGPWPEGWSHTPPPPAPEERGRQFEAAVDARLLAFVRQRSWDSLERALAQRGEFAADAAIAQDAYDATWAAAIALKPQVMAGTITVAAAVERLPVLAWPAQAGPAAAMLSPSVSPEAGLTAAAQAGPAEKEEA